MWATTPRPPYVAVIFSSQRSGGEADYADMADRMGRLAARQPGYLGEESVRDAAGFGITVSYWSDEAAVSAWRQQVDHLAAQTLGRARWYARYAVRVAEVRRAWDWSAADTAAPRGG